jgi:plasmid stability protein
MVLPVPTLTLKGLPADVHRRLKERAARHGRSLNGEAIACLRAAVTVETVDVDSLLARARAHRETVRLRLRDDEVRSLRREGRS